MFNCTQACKAAHPIKHVLDVCTAGPVVQRSTRPNVFSTDTADFWIKNHAGVEPGFIIEAATSNTGLLTRINGVIYTAVIAFSLLYVVPKKHERNQTCARTSL